MQTLTIDQANSEVEIPILIEASNEKFEKKLEALAYTISQNVSTCSSENRKKLHFAAVIVNNFTNHLYSKAEQFCSEAGINFDLLKPLISETANKVHKEPAYSVQTGPAKRKDNKIIQGHLDMLSENKDLYNLYQLITDQITNTTY